MDLNKKAENLIYKINKYISTIDEITKNNNIAEWGDIKVEVERDEYSSMSEFATVMEYTFQYFKSIYIKDNIKKYSIALEYDNKHNICYIVIRWGGALLVNLDKT